MVSLENGRITDVNIVEQMEPDVADLMEKNVMDGVEPSEEATGIEDLLASAGDDEEQMSPDDFVIRLDEATGREIRRLKETPQDFLDDAEANIQNIAGLMMQTLDMMIEMQKSGQQEVVSEPRELETVLSE